MAGQGSLAGGSPALTEKEKFQRSIFFPIGEPNPYGQFFVGQSYLAPVSTAQVSIFNVTFEPGCRNNWHIHYAKRGGGQKRNILWDTSFSGRILL